MFGNHCVPHDKILRARTPHAERMPGVIDLDLGPRNHDVVDEVIVGFGIDHPCTNNKPGRMIAAAAELPASVETPSSRNALDRTLRLQGSRQQVSGIPLVHFSLTLL